MSDTIKIYINPTQPVKAITVAPTGARGADGAAGTNGGSTSAWDYNAKTNATSGYPGNGYLLWNNATQTSATSILVSHLTDDNTDIELLLSFFVINQKIFIQDRDDSSKNQVWLISGTPTVTGANTSTAYYTFPVTLVSSAGGAFTNNHSILFGQISVATNAVTSATTSDGTCLLSVESLSASGPNGSIYTTGSNGFIYTSGGGSIETSGMFIINVGEAQTTLSGTQTANRAIEFPDASGTLALLSNITGTNSGTNTGDQTSIVGITGTTAQFNTALTDGDFATLAGSETLTNKTLTSPAINSATIGTAATFNATSYTYGAGAAAAHRDALGVAGKQSKSTTTAVTSTSGVAADISDLTGFVLEANTTYRLTLHSIITTSSGGSFEFFFIASGTTYQGGISQAGAGVQRSGAVLNGGYHYSTTSFSPLYATQNLSNGHTYGEYYFRTSGTAGTAKMQFAQRSSAVSGTTTIAAGTTAILEKIS
jgi:hypothetical protein